ncbi:hypothetical protein BGX34_001125 [Mortierella sp. NVP85]|nr:hypothetical protein BGX34_001125 [Mortierella sp. NVP85]
MASTNTNKTTLTEKDLEWFSASEDQTPEAFFDHLKTTDRKRAHIRYRRVLRDCAVDEDQRKHLVDVFNAWREAEADAYWEKRKARKSVRKTQIRTAVSLVETSEPFAVDLLQANAREAYEDIHEQARPEEETDPEASTQGPGSKRGFSSLSGVAEDSPTKRSRTSRHESTIDRRTERFNGLDQERFWRLSSGKAVEETLYRASLESDASISVRSYTIDVSCLKTRALFTSQEWDEIVSSVSFQLPELHRKTLGFIEKLRRGLCEGKHPYTIPQSSDPTMSDNDRFDCNLAIKTIAEWHMLYTKEPSPFIVDDLSESWWARASWALLFHLLDDVPGAFMINGEKRGLDSSKRRNMGRVYNPDEPLRKKSGRKLDLICRDEVKKHDWLVVERMRGWDPQWTKFLREFNHDVLRETVTIAHNRMFDAPASFREECTFVGGYTGSRGLDTFQIKPGPGRSYVLIMQHVGQFTLSPVNGGLKEQFQGLVRLLQIRATMKSTIELFNTLTAPAPTDAEAESDEDNLEWYHDNPEAPFDCNQVVSSSPIGPDDFEDP